MSHEAHKTSKNQAGRPHNPAASQISNEAAACGDLVRTVGGGVTFVELARLLHQRGIVVKGEFAICPESDPNLILWPNLSEEAMSILVTFMRHPDITVSPTNWLSYAADGSIPNLPMAFDLPEGGLSEPHWVPVQFGLTRPTGRLKHKLGYELVQVGNEWATVDS